MKGLNKDDKKKLVAIQKKKREDDKNEKKNYVQIRIPSVDEEKKLNLIKKLHSKEIDRLKATNPYINA